MQTNPVLECLWKGFVFPTNIESLKQQIAYLVGMPVERLCISNCDSFIACVQLVTGWNACGKALYFQPSIISLCQGLFLFVGMPVERLCISNDDLKSKIYLPDYVGMPVERLCISNEVYYNRLVDVDFSWNACGKALYFQPEPDLKRRNPVYRLECLWKGFVFPTYRF